MPSDNILKALKPRAILNEAYAKQKEFILDPAKRKAAFVLRRGGKSYALAIYLIYTALKNPRTKSLYMGLTKDSAENVMWLNIIEPLLEKHKIPHIFNHTRKMITFENKSTIQLTGTDASDSQINKYLGGKYILAVFDECQSITHDLKHWIDDMLGPAMIDYGGTICTVGTAGRSIGRYWYDITQPLSALTTWSIHRWSGDDNPSMAALIKEEMDKLKRETKDIEKTEGFRNQYLCEWVLDNTDRVYHNTEANILTDQTLIDSLLSRHSKWKYILGFDFGFEDDTAIVVSAYYKHDPHAYFVETFKKKHMLTEEIAHKLHELKQLYQPIHIVGDCQNKTLVETLRMQYHLPLRPADKLGKEAHIASMNSDFTTKKILIIKHTNQPLLDEWASLTWNEKHRIIGKFTEQASKDNHAADAALYMHHFSKHFRATPEPPQDPTLTPTMIEAEKRHRREQQIAFDMPLYHNLEKLNRGII